MTYGVTLVCEQIARADNLPATDRLPLLFNLTEVKFRHSSLTCVDVDFNPTL
jgi:hypothetical protein